MDKLGLSSSMDYRRSAYETYYIYGSNCLVFFSFAGMFYEKTILVSVLVSL